MIEQDICSERNSVMNDRYNGQPQQQNPPPYAYIPPQRPYIDPAADKKRKTDALNALGDKVSAVMRTNPVLAVIERNADVISYIVTGVSALLTMLSMSLNCFAVVFGYISLIFGFFALSKRSVLPLAVSLSVLSLFKLVCFINSIANFVVLDRYAFFSAGFVISFVFSIFELAAIGYITFIAWTYFIAAMPARPRPQPYYGQPPAQPVQPPPQQYRQPESADVPAPAAAPVSVETEKDTASVSETDNALGSAPESDHVPVSEGDQVPASADESAEVSSEPSPINVQAAAPVLKPLVSAYSADNAERKSPSPVPVPAKQKFCTSCGTANVIEAAFCKQCGHKFQNSMNM